MKSQVSHVRERPSWESTGSHLAGLPTDRAEPSSLSCSRGLGTCAAQSRGEGGESGACTTPEPQPPGGAGQPCAWAGARMTARTQRGRAGPAGVADGHSGWAPRVTRQHVLVTLGAAEASECHSGAPRACSHAVSRWMVSGLIAFFFKNGDDC